MALSRPYPVVMRRMVSLGLCAVLVLGAGACGGSGHVDTGGSAGPREEVMRCLKKAGFQAQVNDSTPIGVDDPVQGITVSLQSQDFDEQYEANVWLFQSDALAKKNRPTITLETKDDVRNKVIGPAVVAYSIVPDTQDAKQVEACL
jgi:hypothetical protein